MFGGLHIEMAALKTLGDWLADSGWTAAITDANIASSGVADSLLAASHLSRTRHAHEVTACSLHIMMKKAYTRYVERENRMEMLSFKDWKTSRIASSPQFQYWSITLDFELTVLIFVQLISCGNFALCKDALSKMLCQRSFHGFLLWTTRTMPVGYRFIYLM